MEYKISAIVITDRLASCETIISIIKNKTKFRLTIFSTLGEAIESSKRKRIDLIIISSSVLADKFFNDAENFFKVHACAVPVIINETTNNSISHPFLPYIAVEPGFTEDTMIAAFDNANEIAKLKSQINKDKGEIVRLLYQLDKMRKQSNKTINNDIVSTELPVTNIQPEQAVTAEDLAISGNLAKVFGQINNFSLKQIASTLEKELPEVLKIRKFSIFLLKNQLTNLDVFASFNFPIQKKTELKTNSLMETSIMFDAIFQRKVIYISDYASTEFAKNQQDGNNYKHNNCLCIPLVSGKKIIGVANFNDSQYGNFSSQQINLILIFANYLAVILDNLQKKV